jgi:hypothetical protein
MFDNMVQIQTKSPVHSEAQLHFEILHNRALLKGKGKGRTTGMILTEVVTEAINPQASLRHRKTGLPTAPDSPACSESMTPVVTDKIIRMQKPGLL